MQEGARQGRRSLEDRNHSLVLPPLRVLERRCAIAIGNRLIGTRSYQSFCRRNVALASIAEHDSLYEGGPAKVVDMIEWRTGFDQRLHHGIMSQMRCCNQGGSVISARNSSRVAPKFDCKFYHAHIVFDGSDCDHIIAIILKGIDVASACNKCPNGVIVGFKSGDMKRCATGLIAHVRVGLAYQQCANFIHTPVRRSFVKSHISRMLGLARRRLTLHSGSTP
jgi:hypothetical protein